MQLLMTFLVGLAAILIATALINIRFLFKGEHLVVGKFYEQY